METIVVYATANSNRLKFVLDWLLKERLHLNYRITHKEDEIADLPYSITYGKPVANSISIPDIGLLWNKGFTKMDTQPGKWNDLPVIFAYSSEDYTLPFDLFSAIFFMLSRYEEYDHYAPDKHGRYPASFSILYKNGWLLRPLVDEWIWAFKQALHNVPGVKQKDTHFLFQPTYDIDMAYSHLHKGIKRIVGAYIRAMMKMDVGQINERTQVLKKKQKDPYDSFRWLRQLHKEYGCQPIYFILAAFKTTAFDKNIHPEHPAMIRVIKNIVRDGVIGVHPSYYSNEGDTLTREKKILEQISGKAVTISRQHYIRVKTPDTYRLLIKNGIKEDYSMGYGAYLGFRAATGNSFFWYDLQNETVTNLRIHPFCFMDSTAFYEAKLSPGEAFEKLDAMCKIARKTGTTITAVFHNFSLGTASEWKGWRGAYEHFLSEYTK